MDNKKRLEEKTQKILIQMGDQIRKARLRRRLSVENVAELAGVSRTTLWSIEKGSKSVSIGFYVRVLSAINMEEDLLLIAKDDEFGRKMQDVELPIKIRSKRNKK